MVANDWLINPEERKQRAMPKQKPGRSKQDYGTPPDFLAAVTNRLHDEFTWDLAASEDNTVASHFYSEKDNSLVQRWHELAGWLWLNPPFGKLEPWARKAAEESMSGAHIAMLVPSSVGSKWWLKWVVPNAYINHLSHRLTFVGEKTPYPKDCSLLLFQPWGMTGEEYWYWPNSVKIQA